MAMNTLDGQFALSMVGMSNGAASDRAVREAFALRNAAGREWHGD
jgi:hypothetical protein